MTIRVLGDIHGEVGVASRASEAARRDGSVALIQVGDWGWYLNVIRRMREHNIQFHVPTYFIDGNHEDHDLLREHTTVTEVYPNLFFVPRGTVLELDGRRIAFMGGAASIDKDYRIRNRWTWSEHEDITFAEANRFRQNGVTEVDVFITHVPPQSVIQAHFDPRDMLQFGVPLTWKDSNADIIETLWHELGRPMIYSGHMHRNVSGDGYRILNIDQSITI